MGATQSQRRREQQNAAAHQAATYPPPSVVNASGQYSYQQYPPVRPYPTPVPQYPPSSGAHFNPYSSGQYRPPSGSASHPPPPAPQPGPASNGSNRAGSEGQLQQTSTIRNAVNLKKNTLKLAPLAGDPEVLAVQFSFDSSTPCSVTTFFMAKEDCANNCKLHGMVQAAGKRVVYPKGLGHQFPPAGKDFEEGHVLKVSLYDKAQLMALGAEQSPLVIRLETALESKSGGKTLQDLVEGDSQPTWVQSQTTFASLGSAEDGTWSVKVTRQKIWVDGVSYELQEIYGMDSATKAQANIADLDDSGSECVICMSNRRDTTVLPCRHMCMCSECANLLRHRTNRCPICRETVDSLLHIKLQGRPSSTAKAGTSAA